MTAQKIEEALEYAESLNNGREKVSVLDDAVRQADVLGDEALQYQTRMELMVVPQDSVERLGGGCKRSGTYPELACPPTGLKRSGDGGKAVPISIQPCRAGDDRRS